MTDVHKDLRERLLEHAGIHEKSPHSAMHMRWAGDLRQAAADLDPWVAPPPSVRAALERAVWLFDHFGLVGMSMNDDGCGYQRWIQDARAALEHPANPPSAEPSEAEIAVAVQLSGLPVWLTLEDGATYYLLPGFIRAVRHLRIMGNYRGGQADAMTEADQARLKVALGGVFGWKQDPDSEAGTAPKNWRNAVAAMARALDQCAANAPHDTHPATMREVSAKLMQTVLQASPDSAKATLEAHAFKNFHRSLCERFGYVHDDKDWRRDQVSLEEFIAQKIADAQAGAAKICCGQFDTCQQPCVPLVEHWREAAQAANADAEPHIDGWPLWSGLPPPAQKPMVLQPVETIRYWLGAYGNLASGPHFQGHGMVVCLLREYLALRESEPAPAPADRPDGMPASAAERQLRRLLAIRVAMPQTYFDDGEAQGAEHGISIDFMREPVADIDAKLRALNVARASASQAVRPAPPSGTIRREGRLPAAKDSA